MARLVGTRHTRGMFGMSGEHQTTSLLSAKLCCQCGCFLDLLLGLFGETSKPATGTAMLPALLGSTSNKPKNRGIWSAAFFLAGLCKAAQSAAALPGPSDKAMEAAQGAAALPEPPDDCVDPCSTFCTMLLFAWFLYRAMEAAQGAAALPEPPDEFVDPITASIMSDPVTLPDSQVTLDRSTVERHLLSQGVLVMLILPEDTRCGKGGADHQSGAH
eukprot:scaffold26175_cov17-Tisochrysis_lutea.AAC.1